MSMQPFSQVQKSTPLPELLAPAGSPESFRAAVAAGADAVYLSGKRFGARKFAPNFTDPEIEEAVSYAHRRDVRVYVTINTLIHDRELTGIAEYLLWLYSIGVDAVLVQDTGVATLARDIVPDLCLHASTQMTIHSTDGVRWAAEQGFSRVVLARELSIDAITRIARETRGSGIGLEVFAHGALCYSFSGQCLLSSMIGGRSGNRGMCAQPCRKPYSLVTGDQDEYGRPTGLHEVSLPGRFLLSPRDLCTYPCLPDLVNSPVVSLKIEGRMRSAEYVAIVVSAYRKALDAIAGGNPDASLAVQQDLLLAFNRGFTSGYLLGDRHGALMGRDAADNRGICIGVVKEYDRRSRTVTITSGVGMIPRPGDGLHFIHPEDSTQESGFSLNTVPRQNNDEIVIQVPFPVKTGSKVYITSSLDLAHRARDIMAHPSSGLRHFVPLDLAITVEPGGRLVLNGLIHARRGRDLPVTYRSDLCLEPARTHPVTRDLLRQQLIKTGDSPFSIAQVTVTYSGDMFAPLAGLNKARRQFLTEAEEVLAASFLPPPERVDEARRRWDDRKPAVDLYTGETGNSLSSSLLLSVYTDSEENVRAAVDGGCDTICFEAVFNDLSRYCCIHDHMQSLETQIHAAAGICRDKGVRFICKLPKITTDTFFYVFLPAMTHLAVHGINEYMVENCGAAYTLMHTNQKPALSGSTGLNIFNHRAVLALSPMAGLLTLSPELSRDDIRILIHEARLRGIATRFALIVQGTSEAMVSEDCIFQPWLQCAGKDHGTGTMGFTGIMDATGHIFPVQIDGECRTHIYNAAELCLIDHLPSLTESGINEVVIDARGRTVTYTRDMTGIYREAITMVKNGIRSDDARFIHLKDEIRRRSLGGITAGHFIRGLKES
jgi:putative protease